MLRLSVLCTILLIAGCATQPSQPPAASAPQASNKVPASQQAATAQKVPSTDGSFTGEVVGAIRPGSKFSKVKIGMTMNEVNKLIKAPDELNRHETGKRWIPFYFGNDAQRLETYYEGEGCLTYTGGNVFGGGDNRLIRVVVASDNKCL